MALPPSPQDDLRRWAERWKRAGAEMERMRVAELSRMTQADAAYASQALAGDGESTWIAAERAAWSGLIEQQRIFLRCHDHPAHRLRRA